MVIQRRKFLAGLLSAFAAPAIVRAESLMPVSEWVWIPHIPDDIPENWDMRLVLPDTNRFRYLTNGCD